jgi:hypothetical protein
MAMPSNGLTAVSTSLVLVSSQNGVTVIPQSTPLTRLNYFDGKFLRADDLRREQLYLRRLVELSNQAGGNGVAYGYDVTLGSGDALAISPGLAVSAEGKVLLLPQDFSIGVQALIDQSRQTTPNATTKAVTGSGAFSDCTVTAATGSGTVIDAIELYLITVGYAEALCGQEDVFGQLCQDACVTSTDRPYLVEGIVIRAVPLQLQTPLPVSKIVPFGQNHLRSRVASAYFVDERNRIASFISGSGLKADVWCLGADAAAGSVVPIGVIARAGQSTVFLDAWIARRERIDTPARRYWQWRMAMRPWDVFLAQILQFQCQLRDVFAGGGTTGGGTDPCAGARTLLGEAQTAVAKFAEFYKSVSARLATANVTAAPVDPGNSFADLASLQQRLQIATTGFTTPSQQVLIDGGIQETPSAGYLPVVPGDASTINDQVRRLMGQGVDLRFCIVRPDYVGHALEEAQHMDRISLVAGLDDPNQKPEVDVLVPNGQIVTAAAPQTSAFAATLKAGGNSFSTRANAAPAFTGAARAEAPADNPVQILFAGQSENFAGLPDSFWAALTFGQNPFAGNTGGNTSVELRLIDATPAAFSDILLTGSVQYSTPFATANARTLTGTFTGTLSRVDSGSTSTPQRITFSVKAILSTPPGQTPSVEVIFNLPPNPVRYSLKATWGGSPLAINVTATQVDDASGAVVQGAAPLLTLALQQNAEVLQPSNALHTSALKALQALGTAIGDANFSPDSAVRLFPPGPPPSDELIVKGTLDWVLFHRRRTKQCGVSQVPATVPSRKYQVWIGEVPNQNALGSTVSALKSNAPFDPKLVTFQNVDIVEFGGGVPSLVTPATAVLADWQAKANASAQIAFAGIASQGPAQDEGDDLARGRLTSFDNTVTSVTPADASLTPTVLPGIHPALATPGVDGIVVILTTIRTTCVAVFATDSAAILARVATLIKAGQIAEALKEGKSLGSVTFGAGTTHVLNDSLTPAIKAWTDAGLPTNVPLAALVITGSATAPADDKVAQDEAALIQQKMSAGTPPAPLFVKATVAMPAGVCPTVTFLAPQPAAKARVGIFVPYKGRLASGERDFITVPASVGHLVANFAPDGSIQPLDPKVLAALKKLGPFIQVEDAPAELSFDATAANKRLSSLAPALVAAGLLQESLPRQVSTLTDSERTKLGGADDLIFLLKKG